MDSEIWKPIQVQGFEGLYLISNLGDVWSVRKKQKLKHGINGGGYKFVVLYNHGKTKIIRIHRMLAEYFVPNPNNLPCVNHKDENKLNNSLDNLEWCTYKYNITYGTALSRRQKTKNERKVHGAEKPIIQYDLNMNFIQEYNSLKSCGYPSSSISNALSGRRKTAYGYIWKYKNNV